MWMSRGNTERRAKIPEYDGEIGAPEHGASPHVAHPDRNGERTGAVPAEATWRNCPRQALRATGRVHGVPSDGLNPRARRAPSRVLRRPGAGWRQRPNQERVRAPTRHLYDIEAWTRERTAGRGARVFLHRRVIVLVRPDGPGRCAREPLCRDPGVQLQSTPCGISSLGNASSRLSRWPSSTFTRRNLSAFLKVRPGVGE